MSTVNRKWQCAGVAQLVEQRIRNAQVVGSSPTTSFKSCLIDRTFYLYWQNVTAPVLIISTQNRLTAICLLQSFYIVFYQFIYPIVDVTEYKSKTLRFFDIDSM